METFSDRLALRIKEIGLGRPEFAARADVGTSALAKWLSGKLMPKSDQLYSLARSLGVTMEWLLTGEEPKAPVFAQWNRGFCVAVCSYAPGLIRESYTYDEDGEPLRLPDEKSTGTVLIFRFHPTGHPESMTREEQVEFVERYTSANADERRRMLCLGPGTERFFSDRTLGAIGVMMRRQLEGQA